MAYVPFAPMIEVMLIAQFPPPTFCFVWVVLTYVPLAGLSEAQEMAPFHEKINFLLEAVLYHANENLPDG